MRCMQHWHVSSSCRYCWIPWLMNYLDHDLHCESFVCHYKQSCQKQVADCATYPEQRYSTQKLQMTVCMNETQRCLPIRWQSTSNRALAGHYISLKVVQDLASLSHSTTTNTALNSFRYLCLSIISVTHSYIQTQFTLCFYSRQSCNAK